mmetsp:Transcript_2611/g.6689  ORF Transcript_2611/g.6689 Transcript_2611/m.6689 type:complete len:229 (-) Transcript_2611:2014-2700(-)
MYVVQWLSHELLQLLQHPKVIDATTKLHSIDNCIFAPSVQWRINVHTTGLPELRWTRQCPLKQVLGTATSYLQDLLPGKQAHALLQIGSAMPTNRLLGCIFTTVCRHLPEFCSGLSQQLHELLDAVLLLSFPFNELRPCTIRLPLLRVLIIYDKILWLFRWVFLLFLSLCHKTLELRDAGCVLPVYCFQVKHCLHSSIILATNAKNQIWNAPGLREKVLQRPCSPNII